MKKYATIAALVVLILLVALFLRERVDSEAGKETTSKPVEQNQRAAGRPGLGPESRNRERAELNASTTQVRDWLPEEKLSHLSAGGLEAPIAFESEISAELQKAIIHDLNLIFGHLDSHEYLDASGAPEISINGRPEHPDRFLNFTGKGRYFPNELTGKIGFMTGDKIVIPANVIEAYAEAWNRKATNEDEYSSLLEAIDRLNGLAGDPIPNPRDWFFLSSGAQAAGIEIPDVSEGDFAENFGGYRYRQPSLLDVFDGAVWDPDLAGKLIAKVYVFDSEGFIRNSMPPLIHTDGAWRFFIVQPPT